MFLQLEIGSEAQMGQKRPSRIWVDPLADEYGLDSSNMRKHIRGKAGAGILGVIYRDGDYFIEGRPGREGPVPTEPKTYALPPGTTGVELEYISGVVSSHVFILSFNADKAKPELTLSSPISGQVVSLITDPP